MKEAALTSLQHPLVKHMVKLRVDSAHRYEQRALALEGVKPILEVADTVTKLFYTPAYASHAASFDCAKWQVSEAILHKMSGMSSPEGLLAEVRLPEFGKLEQDRAVVALDGVNDPGNVGTLMRTALAFGWQTLYFLPGSCDPFNEKALRAARGAHFKLTLVRGTAQELSNWVQAQGVQALVADLKGERPEKLASTKARLLILGNEAHGASIEVRSFCQAVTLPMPGDMESLNVGVAGGILLYLLSTAVSH